MLAVVIGVAGFGETGSQLNAVLGILVLLPLLAITTLGSILSVRHPRNRIAWLLHFVSLDLLLALWTNPLVEAGPPESPGFLVYLAVVTQNALAPMMLYAVFLLLFLFPTGHFMTPRWKWAWAWWGGGSFFSLLLLVAVFRAEVGPDFSDVPWLLANPIGFLPTGTLTAMDKVLPWVILATAIGGVASIVVRFRRSDVVVRTQIKWVLLAAVISAVALPIAVSGSSWLSSIFMMITITAIPTAVTLAITRYKLFEIDRLISRTIAYTLVIALLGGVSPPEPYGSQHRSSESDHPYLSRPPRSPSRSCSIRFVSESNELWTRDSTGRVIRPSRWPRTSPPGSKNRTLFVRSCICGRKPSTRTSNPPAPPSGS